MKIRELVKRSSVEIEINPQRTRLVSSQHNEPGGNTQRGLGEILSEEEAHEE